LSETTLGADQGQEHDVFTLGAVLFGPPQIHNATPLMFTLQKETLMRLASRTLNVAAAVALATLSVGTLAQTAVVYKATCQFIGSPAREPLADREGHTIAVAEYSCHAETGMQEGAIMTGMNIIEYDPSDGVVLSGNGVIRKPGSVAVYQVIEQHSARTMTDGKVTGFTGASRGVYKLATGSMASLAGKSFTSTFRTIGGGQFLLETTFP
jgi:hypothetical protein